MEAEETLLEVGCYVISSVWSVVVADTGDATLMIENNLSLLFRCACPSDNNANCWRLHRCHPPIN